MEKWKNFEETNKKIYFVSTTGKVKNIDKATGKVRILKLTKRTDGYMQIAIGETNKKYYVHRLVALAFMPNPEDKPTINHLDGNKENNAIGNLEWATRKEQETHARKTGLKTKGVTPIIILDSNGEVIAKHNTTVEAFASYDGRQVYYSKDVQVIGNVIAMRQSYYDTLNENERFFIVTNCFKRMLEYTYVADGQLVDSKVKASQNINCPSTTLYRKTKNQWSTNINGHTVSRISVMLHGSVDKNVKTDVQTANAIKIFRNI
ncbi:NUMOD4 motif-containing HNH endonuclease [Bacillus thuringiensis]|uniref:NUMOD4 motif-containing HNH endonuclease n=1 Tax=Bacillus thuringiensis TaxID=1428 RepID=UPI000BF5C36B|nr:NUMOD4 motif-containing HNH endonuclease [Bacillus thuringiensis]PEY76288.1 hypothetical protein CN355_02895 [Bacillus thuringiensis]